jgi:phosphocarrier protein HPr
VSERASRTVRVSNDLGLHLRAAGVLVQLAGSFESEIMIEREKQRANAKSILSLLSLAAARGCELKVEAHGVDADSAVDAICNLIARGFEAASS